MTVREGQVYVLAANPAVAVQVTGLCRPRFNWWRRTARITWLSEGQEQPGHALVRVLQDRQWRLAVDVQP